MNNSSIPEGQMAITIRAFVSFGGATTEYPGPEAAAEATLRILAKEPAGAVVENRVVFSDGDSWTQRTTVADWVLTIMPDPKTAHGQDVRQAVGDVLTGGRG